jgi:hypothetical protein
MIGGGQDKRRMQGSTGVMGWNWSTSMRAEPVDKSNEVSKIKVS